MYIDKELETMLKEPYLDSKKLMTLIRRYKLAKNPIKKEQLRDEIFRNNIRFIRKMVIRKTGSWPEYTEDAFNTAVISFFEGLERFKPNKGFKFHTYMHFWMDKAIYQEFMSRNIVYIPRGDFFKKDSSSVDYAKNSSTIRLDRPLDFDDGMNNSRLDAITDSIININHVDSYRMSEIEDINNAIENSLTNLEQALVSWRYLHEPALTLDEISEIIGMSRERVRQMLASAMFKVRKYVENKETVVRKRKLFGRCAKMQFTSLDIQQMYDEMIKVRKYKDKKV
jgi:RNA polymerase sigma factor (sigma-70 family)